MREDDELWREEDDKEERKRVDWEEEQGERVEGRENAALPTSCRHWIIAFVLLFNVLFVEEVLS